MATTCATLIQRTRRFVRDWPEFDALTASCTSSSATLTVADATIYSPNWLIQIDSEAMVVASGSGTTLTVKKRGARGTTAATHANAASILLKPEFLDVEILDAINAALMAGFPYIHRKVIDESIETVASDYEYAVPAMPGISGYIIPYVSQIEIKLSGETRFNRVRNFRIQRDDTAPFIQFLREPDAGATVRVIGYGPYPPLAVGDSLDAQFPPNAEDLIVWFAAQYLLASGEAGRVRVDTGVIDNREQANRVGSSMQAANTLFQRFQLRLRDAGMPPMPVHVIPTL
jgi:hypothetical protein